MSEKNTYDITVLDDGRVKIETSRFDPASHIKAEKLMAFLQGALGKEISRTKAKSTHTHSHEHGDEGLKV